MITKKANLLHVLNNVYIKKAEPVSIVYFLTNRCNARCSFCFINFDDPNTFKNELKLSEIKELTKNLSKSLLNVNLTKNTKEFIVKLKCNCTYECALSFNILDNWRYQPRLISSVFESY